MSLMEKAAIKHEHTKAVVPPRAGGGLLAAAQKKKIALK